ncbi:MAG: hypothetical protein ACT4P1_02205 [Sporichthyaceae bacterium]
MTISQTIAKILHRAPRTESDVHGDHARVDARDEGGDDRRITEGGTTGSSDNGSFVGRVAGDDHFSGENGSDVRARIEEECPPPP